MSRRGRPPTGLSSSLAKELGRDGITVNAVGSNYVENPDYFPPPLLANTEAMAKMTAQIPLGRLGKAGELGAAICFLCSDGAGFITGHVLPHAGGWASHGVPSRVPPPWDD